MRPSQPVKLYHICEVGFRLNGSIMTGAMASESLHTCPESSHIRSGCCSVLFKSWIWLQVKAKTETRRLGALLTRATIKLQDNEAKANHEMVQVRANLYNSADLVNCLQKRMKTCKSCLSANLCAIDFLAQMPKACRRKKIPCYACLCVCVPACWALCTSLALTCNYAGIAA